MWKCETERGKEKKSLNSEGIEPTISLFDHQLLGFRLSYEVTREKKWWVEMVVISAMWMWHKHECHWQKDNHRKRNQSFSCVCVDVFTCAYFSPIHTKFSILEAFAYRISVNQVQFGSRISRNHNSHMHLIVTFFTVEISIGNTKRKITRAGASDRDPLEKARDGALVIKSTCLLAMWPEV